MTDARRPDAEQLRRLAHELIPGGCHTYAKADDQFPAAAPPFLVRGQGCHAWDLDAREYIEYGMGLRAVTLGHAYPAVIEAVAAWLPLGTNFSRPAPIEVECAERLLAHLPFADMAKFTKDGSTATTAAVRLARAATGRERVAFCASQPFFSYDDWFIASWRMSAGVPEEHRRLGLRFPYNDLDAVRTLFAEHPGQIACVLLEPSRVEPPEPGYLEGLRALCDEHGALLVFDEMITGFRYAVGGAQNLYDVAPDLSTFGKALANGFSVSALVGRREVMSLGGFSEDRDRVFLLSTTHGAETHALAAALATIGVYEAENVVGFLHRQGERLREGCREAARELGLSEQFDVLGHPSNLVFATRDAAGEPSQEFRTLFQQELLRHGILAPSFVVSFSHTDEDVDRTVEATRAALEVYRRGLEDGVETVLEGRPVRPVDRRRG